MNQIRESKEVLFAAFSDKCTKEDKVKAWKGVHETASALGVVPATKDFTYTRDTLWQNLKKNTMVSPFLKHLSEYYNILHTRYELFNNG